VDRRPIGKLIGILDAEEAMRNAAHLPGARPSGSAAEIIEMDGPRGGEYFAVDLSDGRRLVVSRKAHDRRVWLGRPDDPGSYSGQRGGVGTIDKLLNQWMGRMAHDAEAAELHRALSALAARKEA
jgi:hypothetical protein